MAQTVLIYATRRQRTKLAKQGFDFLAEYDAYVLTKATDAQMEMLRSDGYEVEPYQAPAPPQPATRGVHDMAIKAPALPWGPSPSSYGPGQHYYLVEFVGPVKQSWLDEISAHGGCVQEPVPPSSYIIALDQTAYDWLTTAPGYISLVTHYSPEMRINPDLLEGIREEPSPTRAGLYQDVSASTLRSVGAERATHTFLLDFFEPDGLQQALPVIRDMGGVPGDIKPGSTLLTVSFAPDIPDLSAKVERLSHLHGVFSVGPYVLRQVRNDIAAGLMGGKEVSNPSGIGRSGRGEIVGVADSGLDTGDPATMHSDFSGRVAAIHSWPVASDWGSVVTNVGEDDGPADIRSGHGTHVAGSVMGNGAASLAVQSTPVRGLAHEATLVFQAVEQRLKWTTAYRNAYYQRYRRYPPDYGLAGLPVNLEELFQQAYDAGARIHSNSWGGGDFGAYDEYCEAVDRFMWTHKDFLILFAAGNDGSDGDRDGVVDPGSITPPATAKNCITVGAAESVRSKGGYQSGWGQLWPGDYPAGALRTDKPSDDAADIAAFSSRGPTRDQRFKPDVVAPGTNILSVRSQALAAGVTPGWGAWSKSDKYMFDGGTSMATPLTAGATALIRQYLRQVKRRAAPSAALIKATLLHGAQRWRYRYAPAADDALWDEAQGWGHVLLNTVLAPPDNVSVRWYDQRQGLSTGQVWQWSCSVSDSSVPLAFTLVWTDYPATAGLYPNLVNDLDLVITSPSGKLYYGNGPIGRPGGAPDRVNNVERVIFPRPELGRYTIRVRAFNVPRGPQDFALVYSGGIR